MFRLRDKLFHWLFRPRRAGRRRELYDRLFVERFDDS
jgi:hypothetical protein